MTKYIFLYINQNNVVFKDTTHFIYMYIRELEIVFEDPSSLSSKRITNKMLIWYNYSKIPLMT